MLEGPSWLLPVSRFAEIDRSALKHVSQVKSFVELLYQLRANLAAVVLQCENDQTCYFSFSLPKTELEEHNAEISSLIEERFNVTRYCQQSELTERLSTMEAFSIAGAQDHEPTPSREGDFTFESLLMPNQEMAIVLCAVPIPNEIARERLATALGYQRALKDIGKDTARSNRTIERVQSHIGAGFWQRALYALTKNGKIMSKLTLSSKYAQLDLSGSPELCRVSKNFGLITEKVRFSPIEFLRDYRHLDPLDSEQLAEFLTLRSL